MNLIGAMRLQVQFLASISGLRIWRCRELWCIVNTVLLHSSFFFFWATPVAWASSWGQGLNLHHSSDLSVHRPAAVAPIGPLAWNPPYAVDAALKKKCIYSHTQMYFFFGLHLWQEEGHGTGTEPTPQQQLEPQQ